VNIRQRVFLDMRGMSYFCLDTTGDEQVDRNRIDEKTRLAAPDRNSRQN